MGSLRTVPFITFTIALITSILYALGVRNHDALWGTLSADWNLLYHQPWRLVTSPFLHHNFLHFIGNLIFLILFGRQIENAYGRLIVLGVFLGGLVSGHFISITVAHDWLVGISVGVAGLFGFSLIANRRRPWWKTLTHNPLHVIYFIGLVAPLVPSVANLIGYRVSHFGHLGGILYGLAFGSAYLMTPRSSGWRWAVGAVPFVFLASIFYSPWQVEWRAVKIPPTLVTATADCRLKSLEQELYTPTPLTFVNASTKSVAMYWLNYQGEPIFYFWLGPGKTQVQDTFIGHPWCVVDVDSGEAIQAVMVTEPNQTITIR